MTAAIALVGDHRDTVIAHQAIPRALALAGAAAGVAVTWEWVRTDEINPDSGPPALARPRGSLADFAAMNEVYSHVFSAPYPTRTTVGVELPSGMKVEITALAVQG